MAQTIQEVILRVKSDADKAAADMDRLTESVDDTGDSIEQTNKGTGSLTKSFKGLLPALGVAALIAGFKKIAQAALNAADAQAKAEAKLLIAAKGRVNVQKDLIKQAQTLQKTTLFGDEKTIEAQAKLLPLLNGNADAVKQLIPLVQDFAAFSGQDLVSAADLVGKSVGTSTNALGRYGVEIEGSVGSSERLESALSSLNAIAGGQAAEAAKVGLGGWEQFKNIMGDVSEEIGFFLIDALRPLIKVLIDGASSLQVFIAQLRGVEQPTGRLAKITLSLRDVFFKTKEAIQALFDLIINSSIGLGLLKKDAESTGIVMKGFAFIVESLIKPFQVLVSTLVGTSRAVQEFGNVFKSLLEPFSDFDISKPFESIRNFDFDLLKNNFKDGGSAVADAFLSGFDNLGRTRIAEEKGEEFVGDVVQGAKEAAEKVDMTEVAEAIFAGLDEAIGNIEPPDLQDELENRFKVKWGVDFEESLEEIDAYLEEAESKIQEEELELKAKVSVEEVANTTADLLGGIQEVFDAIDVSGRIQEQINKYDELIDKQKEVVSSAKEEAADGNAQQLALEESRLRALEEQRENAINKQERQAKREAALAKSIALANSVAAIAKTAAQSGLSAPVAIPLVLSALAAGIGFVGSLIPSFYDGTEDTGKGGNLDGKGGFHAILHPNERVMTAQQNKRLGGASNEEVTRMYEMAKRLGVDKSGNLITVQEANVLVKEQQIQIDELVAVNKQMLRVLRNGGTSINVDENGFAIRTKNVISRQSKWAGI